MAPDPPATTNPSRYKLIAKKKACGRRASSPGHGRVCGRDPGSVQQRLPFGPPHLHLPAELGEELTDDTLGVC
ncbi:MAG: hypothetical protein WD316_00005, partial [Phycisphaeraceae bacterium]